MVNTQASCTLMFADVCNSTRLYETVGNVAAQSMITELLEGATAEVARHGGTLVKTIGDEILCSFHDAASAVRASLRIQEAADASRDPGTGGLTGLQLRIGLHEGPVLEEDGDVFGDAVNVAARLTDLAKGGQILTTEDTVSRLPDELRAGTRHLDNIPVKGKREPLPVYEVLVEPEDATRLVSGLFKLAPPARSLSLRWAGSEWRLGPAASELMMGRGHHAAIVVEDVRVSREHASIQRRRDKFILSDQSSNGTYVQIQGEAHYLRREEIELQHAGRISLGRAFDDPDCAPIEFQCDEPSSGPGTAAPDA